MIGMARKLVDDDLAPTPSPTFPSLSVGVTYLPIPIGGAILLLFVIERVC